MPWDQKPCAIRASSGKSSAISESAAGLVTAYAEECGRPGSVARSFYFFWGGWTIGQRNEQKRNSASHGLLASSLDFVGMEYCGDGKVVDKDFFTSCLFEELASQWKGWGQTHLKTFQYLQISCLMSVSPSHSLRHAKAYPQHQEHAVRASCCHPCSRQRPEKSWSTLKLIHVKYHLSPGSSEHVISQNQSKPLKILLAHTREKTKHFFLQVKHSQPMSNPIFFKQNSIFQGKS